MAKRVVELVLNVPVTHEEEKGWALRPITDFFDEEDKARGWTTGKKLADRPELVSDTAERDSEWACQKGIPPETNWVLFVSKDGICYVCRIGGRLSRICYDLGDTFGSNDWVACPRK